jgi:sulfopyruvate decarboxylase subunit alpha
LCGKPRSGYGGAVVNSYARIVASLKECGVNFIVHIPDKVLLPLIEEIENDSFFKSVLVTREEEGVGVAAGACLGGKKAAILMQSTGLGNMLNALTSVNIVHQIPLLIIMSVRGSLFEYNPADVPLGKSLDSILKAIGLPYFTPDEANLYNTIRGSVALSETSKLPVAIGFLPGLLEKSS